MPQMNVAKYALMAFELIPQLLAAGVGIAAHIQATSAVLRDVQANGRDISDAEWAALNARIDAQLAELDKIVKGDAAQSPAPPAT